MSTSVNRLYTQFHPIHYDLTVAIDENAMHFYGKVTIRGNKVGRPSQRLTFHTNGLKVTSATIVKHDKKGLQEIPISRINTQKSLQEVRLHSDVQLFPGGYEVTLQFNAPISDGMTGLYPCYYKDGDVDKMLFATQFESHHAREVFPCVDEPEAKATFDLHVITTTQDTTVLGNTPIHSQKSITLADSGLERWTYAGDLRLTSFETTPIMSSYLLAFVTGDMQSYSVKTESGVEVGIWSTKAHPIKSLEYAADVAKKSIEYFETYFDVPYPLAKADHVALPDFSSGAMENWGLITYRERLLVAYDDAAQSTKEHIALVIAHETSHQWFGNLVTMRWWDNLWLNESFANMMEYAAVDDMFPQWHVWDSFVAAEGLSALRRDGLFGVQAVQTPVHHPDEISSLFDPSIVYAKGGRLLNMLKQYVGEEAFRAGLSEYFKTHAYKNTEADDLWASLSAVSGKDIGAFMTPWLTRSGYPLLTIDLDGKELRITQQHFLDNMSKADDTLLWPVPLFAHKTLVPELLTKQSLRLGGVFDDLILDPNAYGHYLTRYTSSVHTQAIEALVRSQELSAAGRLMQLNSLAMTARAGLNDYGHVLRFISAYENETSEPVWDMIALTLGDSRRFIDQDPSIETSLRAMSARLASTLWQKLGWDEKPGESAADTKLRALMLGMMIYGEDTTTLDDADAMYRTWIAGNTMSIPAELRAIVLSVPIRNGDDEAFAALMAMHDETQNGDLKGDICDALTSTKQPNKALELLPRLKDKQLVKPQDVDRWLVSLLRNRYTRAVAWDWMVENWQWLEDTFKNDKSYDYLPRYAATCVNTREYEQKYRDLFGGKVNQPLLKRNIELGFEEIESRLSWLERDIASVQEYFKNQSP